MPGDLRATDIAKNNIVVVVRSNQAIRSVEHVTPPSVVGIFFRYRRESAAGLDSLLEIRIRAALSTCQQLGFGFG
jgi:hypothetical protein